MGPNYLSIQLISTYLSIQPKSIYLLYIIPFTIDLSYYPPIQDTLTRGKMITGPWFFYLGTRKLPDSRLQYPYNCEVRWEKSLTAQSYGYLLK